MEIYEKLLTVQCALKAPKSQYNSFGKYNYRNCEDILEALKPILKEVKATVLITDSIEMIGERYYVKATAQFFDCDKPGLPITTTAYAREEESKKGMDGSQVTGASSSYARKYALNGMFAIDDNKDSDTTNGQDKQQSKPKQPANKDNAQPKAVLSDATKFSLNRGIKILSGLKGCSTNDVVNRLEQIIKKPITDINEKEAATLIDIMSKWEDGERAANNMEA